MVKPIEPPASLRLVPWLCIFFSIPLSIPYAVCMDGLTPAIGLIFLAISCGFSLLDRQGVAILHHVIRRPAYEYRIVLGEDANVSGGTAARPEHQVLLLLTDAALAIAHAILFSITIVEMVGGWHYDHAEILGTFASMPYIVASFTHGFLALNATWKLALSKAVAHCPHCHKAANEPVAGSETARVYSDEGSPKMSGAEVTVSEPLVEA